MLVHPNFDPIAFSIGPLSVHWYGIMYLCAFASVYLLLHYRLKTYPRYRDAGWSSERISDLIFYGVLGAVIGGRLGYVLFYKPDYYLNNLLDVFFIHQGGMSFHGGLLGVIAVAYLVSRKSKMGFLAIGDFVAPVAPLGLFFGRMGNFINQELWGKVTTVPWGMVFSNGGPAPRHPSMLYEALLEGLLLWIVIWLVARRPRHAGMLSGLFLIGYAVSRIIVEFVRVPDEHLNYLLFDWVTMGQVLSLPMLLLGLFLIFRQPNKH